AMSREYIVFARGNELWRVGRAGGEAASLHVWANENSLPKFSADGRHIAFLSRFSRAYELGTVSVDGDRAKLIGAGKAREKRDVPAVSAELGQAVLIGPHM